MICSLKNDRKGNPPLPEIWASWPNKNRYVLLNKHSLQKYIGEQLEATVCTANQHWWGFTVLKQSSYYNTRLCCIKRNSIMYKVEALWKQRAHTTNGNIHTHTPTPPPTRTPPHTRTHTHQKKHTHSLVLLFCFELWWRLNVFGVIFLFNQSPCWTTRCHVGSSRGQHQSWRPATKRMGWRSLLAGLPPRT